jgi:hypothetical protein
MLLPEILVLRFDNYLHLKFLIHDIELLYISHLVNNLLRFQLFSDWTFEDDVSATSGRGTAVQYFEFETVVDDEKPAKLPKKYYYTVEIKLTLQKQDKFENGS